MKQYLTTEWLDAGIPLMEKTLFCAECDEPLPQERRGNYIAVRWFVSAKGMVCKACVKPFEYRIELPKIVFSREPSAASTASDE